MWSGTSMYPIPWCVYYLCVSSLVIVQNSHQASLVTFVINLRMCHQLFVRLVSKFLLWMGCK